MPASRRTSASEHDEELAGHLQGLSLAGDGSNRISPAPGNAPHSTLTKGPVRTVTNPTLTLSATLDELSAANKLGGAVSASATPHTTQHSQGLAHPGSAHMPTSRCKLPSGALDNLSVTTRSVPATPLSSINGTAAHLRTLGTPRTPGKALPLKSAPKVLFRPTRILLMLAICKPHCLTCPRVSMKIVRYHSTRSRLDTRTPSK
jgi:hypothetical protein